HGRVFPGRELDAANPGVRERDVPVLERARHRRVGDDRVAIRRDRASANGNQPAKSSHTGVTATNCSVVFSTRSGLRNGRPKPSNATTITSASCKRIPAPKLNASAPKKWICASPGRRWTSYLKW